MAFQNTSMMPFPSSRRSLRKLATRLSSGLLALSLSVGVALPSFAADPFREGNPYQIGDRTEEAFNAIFREGNYVEAERILALAETEEPSEPLVHAMLASMAYLEGEEGLDEVLNRALLTQQSAQDLMATSPLRGHLYTAVGTFLEGAHILKTQGVAQGTPTALGMLQEVFNSLDEAEKIDAQDPELNLLKGYMDLMLAVNLPFSNPEEAITQMDTYGSPVFLAQRGIAIGYRDLAEYDKALIAVDRALTEASDNPELLYLKAQLLVRSGDTAASLPLFSTVLESVDQLPAGLVRQIRWEECKAAADGRNCEDFLLKK